MRRLLTLTALGLALPTLAMAQTPAPTEDRLIAVISAFAPEWTVLQHSLANPSTTKINGVEFVQGEMGGKKVVLFLSGISMVNASMTTQLALDHFNIGSIVFSGIAGGINPDLNIGDVVVPDAWGNYLETIMARETDGTFAIPPFLQSDYPNFGMIFTADTGVVSNRSPDIEQRFWFPADPGLMETARKIAAETELTECNDDNDCLTNPPQIHVGGNGVSGTAFVDNADLRDWIHSTFDAQVVDMESAAVAQVAYVNQIPFIAFRSLSDLAGGGEGENEMGIFMSLAAANSAELVKRFVTELPADQQ